ncbi:hypothetical protein JCM17380_44860 [Desulfosporosinus burensis]
MIPPLDTTIFYLILPKMELQEYAVWGYNIVVILQYLIHYCQRNS